MAAWLRRLVAELAPFRGAGASADDADAEDSGPPSIGNALGALATPPSTQPSSRLELEPGLDETFGSASDALPSLLTVMRPELAPVLYDAWRDLEATPPSQLRIYALRARASAFGHNAPLDTVRTDEGIVTATREWTLFRDDTVGIAQDFSVALSIPDGAFGSPPPMASIAIQFGEANAEATVSVGQLQNAPFTLELGQDERVVVTLKAPRQSPFTPGSVAIEFVEAGMAFSTTLERTARLRWSSRGSDPTNLEYELSSAGDNVGLLSQQQRWRVRIEGTHQPAGREPTEEESVVSLDAPRPAIVPGGWAVVERPPGAGSPPRPGLIIARVAGVREASRADYGITGRSTLVELDRRWLDLSGDTFTVIRESAIYAQSEALELLDEPIDPVLEPVCDGEIALERLYDGLKPGRRLIVAGERADVTLDAAASADGAALAGVRAVEVVMLASVRQDVDLSEAAAKTRTTLVLAAPLAYCYRRDTITVYGNVLKATHGETRRGGARQRRRDAPRPSLRAQAEAAHLCLRAHADRAWPARSRSPSTPCAGARPTAPSGSRRPTGAGCRPPATTTSRA